MCEKINGFFTDFFELDYSIFVKSNIILILMKNRRNIKRRKSCYLYITKTLEFFHTLFIIKFSCEVSVLPGTSG